MKNQENEIIRKSLKDELFQYILNHWDDLQDLQNLEFAFQENLKGIREEIIFAKINLIESHIKECIKLNKENQIGGSIDLQIGLIIDDLESIPDDENIENYGFSENDFKSYLERNKNKLSILFAD